MRDNVKSGALTEVTFYILLSLYSPKHGYAVMQFIEEKTGGRLSLGAGTLYGALNSMQEKECMGNTLYIGSLQSEVYFCIYEKDYEQYKKHDIPIADSNIKFFIRRR